LPAPSGKLTAAAFLLTVLGSWAGCSIEQHYGVLSFFFDGVPQPGSVTTATGGVGATGRRVPGTPAVTVSAHTAYAERRCEDCHGPSTNFGFVVSGFSKLGNETCAQCHDDIQTAWPRVHGPVAAGDCLWCHQPHESPYPALLAQGSPDLCLQCHAFELEDSPSIPHQDLRRDCLSCHRGHGGDAPYFLHAAADVGPEATGATDGPG
jgi:predicted CXXCH cytochrome family protein